VSAWDRAWGSSWGSAWGVVPPTLFGGGVFRNPSVASLFKEDFSEQIKQEDEIIILAVAQLIVQGAFT